MVVGLGSAAVLAFLISNLRYRKLELLAEEEIKSRPAVSPSALVIQLLADLRKEEPLLSRVQTPNPKDAQAICRLLSTNCRKEDVHRVVENGVVVSRFTCSLDHAEGLGKRLVSILTANGFSEGACSVWEAELDTEALLTWVLKGDGHHPTGPMRLKVDVSDAVREQEPPESSPAIDPVTGVFRQDRVSRAIRQRMADRSRQKHSVTLLRIQVGAPDSSGVQDEVMKKTAGVLMAGCRETDLIGRSGESEFVLCLDGQPDALEAVAYRLHNQLREGTVETRMGMASLPDHGDNPGVLFESAGKALEVMKGSVEWYDPSMDVSSNEEEPTQFGKEQF